MSALRKTLDGLAYRQILIIMAVVALSAIAGIAADNRLLVLVGAAIAGITLVMQPILGLFLIILAALIAPLEINTGTEVLLNPATLLIPALFVIWLMVSLARRRFHFVRSRTTLPLALFIGFGLISLLIGSAIWDPAVPRSANAWLVQLAQWALYGFAALVFWLSANLINRHITLKRLTFLFFTISGILVILFLIPTLGEFVRSVSTAAIRRAPFWALMVGLTGGQLFFNRRLNKLGQALILIVFLAVLYTSFFTFRSSASIWIGALSALLMLVWLSIRWLRWPAAVAMVILIGTGFLVDQVFEFAGGEEEWLSSGASRVALIERVLEESMHNPITGLGPAAYRWYGGTRPLVYRNIIWYSPRINSHNNYVDIFSQFGIIGLGLFAWFVVELGRVAVRLRRRYQDGFASGYINGMLAVGAGSLAIMFLADWILPFVYNIGFPGFQASLLVWLFLGGLVALENMDDPAEIPEGINESA